MMEVSNDIKEEIRKTQSDLKNAIRVHQVWISRLQKDQDNLHIKTKIKEAENEIVIIGQAQKLVVNRLRQELELYQQRLRARNKPVNIDNDNRYIAQQLKDYQLQHKNRTRPISLLKPSVLNEIQTKTEHKNGNSVVENVSDSDNDAKSSNDKGNSSNSDLEEIDRYHNFSHVDPQSEYDREYNNAIKPNDDSQWQELEDKSNSSSSVGDDHSPSPSPPLLPETSAHISQEIFMRLIGLVTPAHKEVLEKKRSERRKRATTSTNRNDFLYDNYDLCAKRRKPQFPYLQVPTDPPQTRLAKLRREQKHYNRSREDSPSGSYNDNKNGSGKSCSEDGANADSMADPPKCYGCGRNDVRSLLVRCGACGVRQHTGCAGARCAACRAPLPDPAHDPPHEPSHSLYTDKLAERIRLQERNIQLCLELKKLEARAANLKENLDEHNAEKRKLLTDQIRTQRNLQKLLDFINQFKEASVSIRSTSISESSSEISKSNED